MQLNAPPPMRGRSSLEASVSNRAPESDRSLIKNESKPIADLALDVYRHRGYVFAEYALSDLLHYRFGSNGPRKHKSAKLDDTEKGFMQRRKARRHRRRQRQDRQRDFRALMELVHADIRSGPWCCGGAVVRLIGAGHTTTCDFDLFYRDRVGAEDRIRYLQAAMKFEKQIDPPSITAETREDYERDFGPLNPHSARYQGSYKGSIVRYDFVMDRIYDRVEWALLGFDFRVCMMATDGELVVAVDGAVTDAIDQNLHIVRPTIQRRVRNYMNRGYILWCPRTGMRHDLNQGHGYDHVWPDEIPGIYRKFKTFDERMRGKVER